MPMVPPGKLAGAIMRGAVTVIVAVALLTLPAELLTCTQ